MFSNSINELSGVEVALHMLGIPMKKVMSVEIRAMNR
jgi:hypothetical protein